MTFAPAYALFKASGNKRETRSVDRLRYRRELGHDVATLATLLKHPEYALQLAFGTLESIHHRIHGVSREVQFLHASPFAALPPGGDSPRIPPLVPREQGLSVGVVAHRRENGVVSIPEHQPQDAPLDGAWLADAVGRSLAEDLGGDPGRDVTTQATIDPQGLVTGEIVARVAGVVAGTPVIVEALRQVAARWGLSEPMVTLQRKDGDRVAAGDVIAEISGLGWVVLTAERTILNLLGHASGIATHTRRWADALEGTGARVLDTRKTTPMLRELEKYAVRCGGGLNKRMGLYDVALIKDNHVVAAGGVAAAVQAVSRAFPEVSIQVEVERLSQAREAVDAGARFLLLDNMTYEAMGELVKDVRSRESETGTVELEVTGGLTLDRAASIAALGVDFMSVGALTHSSPALDIALDLH